MGLIKKEGYEVKGVTIKPAYAKILYINTRPCGEDDISHDIVYATFGISNNRENLKDFRNALETKEIRLEYDRKQDKIFNQIYTEAKEDMFEGWEDDIVSTEE